MEQQQQQQQASSSSSKDWQFGAADRHVQLYTCPARDLSDLTRDILPAGHHPNNNNNSTDISSWFRNDDQVAFYGPKKNHTQTPPTIQPMTYADLQQQMTTSLEPPFTTTTRATSTTTTTTDASTDSSSSSTAAAVIGLLLPASHTAEWAVTLLTLMHQGSSQNNHNDNNNITIAPLDPHMPWPKLRAALIQLKCSGLVTTPDLYQRIQEQDDDNTTNESSSSSSILPTLDDIRLIQPNPSRVGAVTWHTVKTAPLQAKLVLSRSSQEITPPPPPPALLLRTSGTTSEPKLVPITLEQLHYNATCLAASLQLQRHDISCHAMPLFHIGGIAGGLLATLVSGTAAVLLPGPFEANAFLDALTMDIIDHENNHDDDGRPTKPTWYTGVPSMHKALLLVAQGRRQSAKTHALRMIRNGAAHLSHGTALEMAATFGVPVVQSYSMSECMPISSMIVSSSNSCGLFRPLEAPASTTTTEEKKEDGGDTAPPRDTVGVPIGCSVAIVDPETGKILPYRSSDDEPKIGEVCIQGPGVMHGYIGMDKTASHVTLHHPTAAGNHDNWFRTGDMGSLDRHGRFGSDGAGQGNDQAGWRPGVAQ